MGPARLPSADLQAPLKCFGVCPLQGRCSDMKMMLCRIQANSAQQSLPPCITSWHGASGTQLDRGPHLQLAHAESLVSAFFLCIFVSALCVRHLCELGGVEVLALLPKPHAEVHILQVHDTCSSGHRRKAGWRDGGLAGQLLHGARCLSTGQSFDI